MLNMKVVSLSLGVSAAVSFVVCVMWGLVMPESLHMNGFLELVLPGFRWLSAASFVVGIVESFLFGVYAGMVYVPIRNFFTRRYDSTG